MEGLEMRSILMKLSKVVLLSFLFLAFGCSDNKTDQNEGLATNEDPVVNNDEAMTTDDQQREEGIEPEINNASDAETRMTYVQPSNSQKNDDKLVLNTTSNQFKELDQDNNNIVNKEELYGGLFNLLDSDGNGSITSEEFKNSKQEFISKNPQGRFSSYSNWDTNSDKEMNKEEFENRLSSIIDVADDRTLAQNTYVVWDLDDDDKIEKLELDNVVMRFDEDSN